MCGCANKFAEQRLTAQVCTSAEFILTEEGLRINLQWMFNSSINAGLIKIFLIIFYVVNYVVGDVL